MKTIFRNLLSELQFLIIIICMIIVIGVVGFSLLIISHRMLTDLKTRSIATADEMEALLQYPLYAVDDAQAVRIAETFLSSGKISGIVLESSANGILLSKTAGKDSLKIPKISREISRGGLLLGKITATFSDEVITSIQSRLLTISLIIIIAVLLASIAANRFIVTRRIKKPFNSIVSAIREISEGKYETQINSTTYNDVNILVSLFNDMAGKINQKNQEQKKIEEVLRESERKARAILDLSCGFIGLLNPKGLLIQANQTALDFVGIKMSDVAGKPFWETPWWNHSKDMQERLCEAVRVAASGELVRFEATHYGVDGKVHDVDVSLKPVKDESGHVVMLIPEGRDVTERKKAEEKLQKSEEKYREFVENANSIILRMDNVGVITFFNEYALKFFGFSIDEVIGRNVVGTIVPAIDSAGKDLTNMILDIGVNPGRYVANENENICKDGKRVWVSWTNKPILDNLGKCIEVLCIGNDSTERKKAEEALYQSERRFRSIIQGSLDVIVVLDENGKVTYESPSTARILGYAPGYLIGRSPIILIHPEDLSRVQEDLMAVFTKTNDGNPTIFRLRRADGTWIHLEAIGSNQLENPAVCGIVITARDITTRIKAEILKKESELFLKETQRIARLGGWKANLETDYLEWTDGVYDIIEAPKNYRPGLAEGLKYFLPKYIPIISERLTKCHSTGIPFLVEAEVITDTGKLLWVEVRGLVPVEEGERSYVVGTLQDITERKKAEEALHESEERYRALFDSSLDCVFLIDFEGRFIDANQAVLDLLGYRKEDINNQTLGSLLTEDQLTLVFQRMEEVRSLGYQKNLAEYTVTRKDGEQVYVEVHFSLICRDGKPFAVQGIAHDITRRKHDEEEREKLYLQLSQSQKMESVGRLAGGVAHDFNNMLSAILGHAELAMMSIPKSDPLYSELEAIQTAANRSADLTRQLLAFARRQTVAPRAIDINDTVSGMLKMLLRLIGEDINLVWMPGAVLWPVKVDPSQIDQIMVNLCVNARDAIIGMGKITIETDNTSFDQDYCAVHPSFECGEYVMLAVSDDGCGMPKEVFEHLFEPFFTTKEVGKGTGLGLATVYGVVKQNHGFINVYSEQGRGTAIKIYIPRLKGKVIESVPESKMETPEGQGETVLLVEDEPIILDVSRAMLERLNYNVLTAGKPGEAVNRVKAYEGEIHLLITDVVMPEMNGRELSKVLSEIKPGMKCLFASGYTANTIAHHGVLEEGVNFIQKPFSMHDLAVKVREVLGLLKG